MSNLKINGATLTLFREENKLMVNGVEFKVFSRFDIDTDDLKCSVLIIEDYGEPLDSDGFAKLSRVIDAEIATYKDKILFNCHCHLGSHGN